MIVDYIDGHREEFGVEPICSVLEIAPSTYYAAKNRAPSARATLACALHTSLRLLAPFLPYVTEEVWSWWQEGSVHHAAWPVEADLGSAAAASPSTLRAISKALAGVRGVKSQAKVKMRTEVTRAVVTGPEAEIRAAEAAAPDLRAAGAVTGELEFVVAADATELSVAADLAAPEAPTEG